MNIPSEVTGQKKQKHSGNTWKNIHQGYGEMQITSR